MDKEEQKKGRVIIAHGWDGYPEEGWFPWLKSELENRGFDVVIPQLPDPGSPRIYKWVPALTQAAGEVDERTFFVGHSMGCQTIARYLEGLSREVRVGGVVFVAGFFKRLTGLEDDPDVRETDSHWLEASLDFEKVKSHIATSVAIFSDDDPWVPLENADDYRDKLGSEIIIDHAKGHFSGSRDKAFEVPIVLAKLLEMSGVKEER